ncbi:MAG: two-component system, NtrC family, sensor kinase [Blastocatellia bacterium]|jgi:PAS domain S-box-containing protein|nr:two-component system, NtrC family, sensor kinase [Blastocatellia bacterium]
MWVNFRSATWRSLWTAAIVGLALLGTLQVKSLGSRTPFALFFAAVILVTIFAGRAAGLVAILLSALAAEYFIIPPLYSLMPTEASIFQIATFVLVAFLINWLSSTHQSSAKVLRKSEERLQTVIENLREGLTVFNLEGDILYFNRSALEMHGFNSPEECRQHRSEFHAMFQLSEPNGSILPMRDWPLARVLRGEQLRNLEVRIKRRDSNVDRVFNYSGSLVRNESQKSMLAIVTMTDISERKQAEEELKNSHKELEDKSAELAVMTQQLWQTSKLATMGELSATIAHELNNPLTTLSLNVEALLFQLPPDDPSRHALGIVEQEIERMAMLVRDLLEFSRQRVRQVSTLNLQLEINTAVAFLSYYLRNRKNEVVCDFASDLPTIQGDRQQFRQVFLNLITNASDAMPGGGRLEIKVRRHQVNGAAALAIQFIDSGTGIPEGVLKQVWDSFFTTKGVTKGTGLGLAICRRVIEEHNGTINLESKVGSGTTVTILIPATIGHSLEETAVSKSLKEL